MCRDNALSYLNYIGYNVIAFPRVGIEPLLVLAGKEQRLQAIGSLSDFLTGAAAPPAISRDEDASKIASQRSSRMDSSAGLNVTGRFLQAMGAEGSLGGRYKHAAHLQIVFDEVLRDAVVPQHIDDYLVAMQAKPRSLLLDAIAERGRAWIVTETLKARSFGVVAFDHNGGALDVSATLTQEEIGAKVKVSADGREKQAVYYHGDSWLRFGFKAMEMTVDPVDKEMAAALRARLRDRGVVMKGDGDADEGTTVFTPDELMEL